MRTNQLSLFVTRIWPFSLVSLLPWDWNSLGSPTARETDTFAAKYLACLLVAVQQAAAASAGSLGDLFPNDFFSSVSHTHPRTLLLRGAPHNKTRDTYLANSRGVKIGRTNELEEISDSSTAPCRRGKRVNRTPMLIHFAILSVWCHQRRQLAIGC